MKYPKIKLELSFLNSYIMYNFIKILPTKQCPTKFNK